ncbi:MAG: hypothetical protein DBY37_08065 [Desulfovibrionaceae bacterium]|nr:MAG: hypothetical protein DBY37_08065 [Desulfovibrionaceae bacterium]
MKSPGEQVAVTPVYGSIFGLKMLPESSGARLRRDAGAAAMRLRRTAPASGVKPAGQNMGSWPADIFNGKML